MTLDHVSLHPGMEDIKLELREIAYAVLPSMLSYGSVHEQDIAAFQVWINGERRDDYKVSGIVVNAFYIGRLEFSFTITPSTGPYSGESILVEGYSELMI